MSDLASQTRALARRAGHDEIDALFDDAFRFAIAGLVKAGKSTLLNALIGERLAPTDADECTRIVSWYRQGGRYGVSGVTIGGDAVPLRFTRDQGLDVDLGGRSAGDYERLEITCPSPRLTARTLVDLPGHGSLSADVSARAERFLASAAGGSLRPVDAVIYLTRHNHPADVSFLEAFHGEGSRATSTSAVTVLSRADELGGGRADAMETARRVAATMAADERLRSLSTDVVPVAGLLAETATTLRNDEITVLRLVADAPESVREAALLSVGRFVAADELGATEGARASLVERLGMYGLRIAVDIVGRTNASPDALTSGLAAASGIGELRRTLNTRFFSRAGVLRARTALDLLAASDTVADDPDLAEELQRIRGSSPELAELDLLDSIRSGLAKPVLGATEAADIERLLGGDGPSLEARLAADRPLGPDEARSMLEDERRRWAGAAESPLATPGAVQLAEAAMRTCDALMAGTMS